MEKEITIENLQHEVAELKAANEVLAVENEQLKKDVEQQKQFYFSQLHENSKLITKAKSIAFLLADFANVSVEPSKLPF